MVDAKKITIGHRSFSSFTSWVKCGKAWQLERELHVPTGAAWYFVGGSAFHLAVEKLLKGEVSVQETND